MANAKKCDRCGKLYSESDLLEKFKFKDSEWRYSLKYDAHPYPAHQLDLCPDCLKSLYSWLCMENN